MMEKSFPLPVVISLCGILPENLSEWEPPMPRAKPKPLVKPYPLRLPEDLYEAIAVLAEAEVRPVNSQIIVLLREALAQCQGKKQPSP